MSVTTVAPRRTRNGVGSPDEFVAMLARAHRDAPFVGRARERELAGVWSMPPEERHAYFREETRRKREEAACPECGRNLLEAGRIKDSDWNWLATYCSNACKQKAYRKRVTAARIPPRCNDER